MGTPDVMVALFERIAALNARMEDHLSDPGLDAATKARLRFLHGEWRETLAANVAAMERLEQLMRAFAARQLDSTSVERPESP